MGLVLQVDAAQVRPVVLTSGALPGDRRYGGPDLQVLCGAPAAGVGLDVDRGDSAVDDPEAALQVVHERELAALSVHLLRARARRPACPCRRLRRAARSGTGR